MVSLIRDQTSSSISLPKMKPALGIQFSPSCLLSPKIAAAQSGMFLVRDLWERWECSVTPSGTEPCQPRWALDTGCGLRGRGTAGDRDGTPRLAPEQLETLGMGRGISRQPCGISGFLGRGGGGRAGADLSWEKPRSCTEQLISKGAAASIN